MHHATLAAVVERFYNVYDPAIVPHQDVVGTPAVPIDETILSYPGHQIVDELSAFLFTETDDPLHVGRTDIK